MCPSFFRGYCCGSSQNFPKLEPAQHLRCGIKFFYERAVVLFALIVLFSLACIFFGAIMIRSLNSVHHTRIDWELVDEFDITCSGCKIQITNSDAWTGLFRPSNLVMFLPRSGSMIIKTPFDSSVKKGELPKFCQIENRNCHLFLLNTETLAQMNHVRVFTEDSIDEVYHPWPTVDLVVPDWWTGQLTIWNDLQSNPTGSIAHKTVIIPHSGERVGFTTQLYPTLSLKKVVLPPLALYGHSARHPIIFNGFRGGNFSDITMDSVTGAFVARGATFGSSVKIDIPLGDIIISANQQIDTTVSSIYAATPPVLSTPPQLNMGLQPTTQLTILLTGSNFRNIKQDDFKLIVPNGTCTTPSPLPGLGAGERAISFNCNFRDGISVSGAVSGPMLLSYFGGNLLSTGYQLSFSTVTSPAPSILSPSITRISNPRISSGPGCKMTGAAAGNVCAVAATGTPTVPFFTSSNADAVVTMLPSHGGHAHSSFKFSSAAARSLTLGSFMYSFGYPLSDYAEPGNGQALLTSIASCPVEFDRRDPTTLGRIASLNPNYNIPYEEQQNLLSAVNQLYQGNVSFVVIKVNGGGANLPGYFSLTLRTVYNVRAFHQHDPNCPQY